jgi:hypothetical protein
MNQDGGYHAIVLKWLMVSHFMKLSFKQLFNEAGSGSGLFLYSGLCVKKGIFSSIFVAVGSLIASVLTASAQSTVFTYQGHLVESSVPPTGVYDVTFALFDAVGAGNQLSGTVTNLSVGITNGLFTTPIDFGANFPGTERWLEIGVRHAGVGTYSVLTPRQHLTSTPYAITAANLSGNLPATQILGTVPASVQGSLTNHTDVGAGNLGAGQVLAYNGALWTNGLPAVYTAPSASNNIAITLSYSGTNVPVNAALGTHFRLLATNNFVLQNPTGAGDAQRLMFEIIQDATGGRTMTLGSAFKLSTDIPFVNLSTNANGRDFLTCVRSGTNFYVLGLVKGY